MDKIDRDLRRAEVKVIRLEAKIAERELIKKIARRIKTLREEGCWVDKEAWEQVFICPTIDCDKCFVEYGMLALIKEVRNEPRL